MDFNSPVLVIPDLQIPFENEKALEFCTYLKRHYRIPNSNILCVGDEIDAYHGGRWPKDPDGHFTASGELAVAREKLKAWVAEFPEVKVAISNHGLRWVRKATGAEIPSQLLKNYHDIFELPESWQYKREWRFNDAKHPFRMIHGLGYSGMNGHRMAAVSSGISTVIGHIHSHAGIAYVKHEGTEKQIWGFNTGCLIDCDQYAFEYERDNRVKPLLGAGLIMASGKTPVWIPL